MMAKMPGFTKAFAARWRMSRWTTRTATSSILSKRPISPSMADPTLRSPSVA